MICDLQRPRLGLLRAWLIMGAPKIAERQAWAKAFGDVTVKMMIAPKRNCIERVRASAERAHVVDRLVAVIDRWFDGYEPAL